MAAIYFAVIADRVGRLSDDNGVRTHDDFLSLSASDIEHEIDKLAGVLSGSDLDSAIQKGLCEPVDFLTPLNDPNFYLGTDVQPGHLAAGLLAERPEGSTRVLDALDERRAVLIAGPSGSGKSGLMWEAARNSRHTVRWFRIRRAEEADVPELLRLADSFRATPHMPIGFVVDDVGRNRAALWDGLASEAASRTGVLVLGSIREEDVFLVTRRSLVTEIRQLPDHGLAERIWEELRTQKLTDWPGWREPWQRSGELLLEYTHLLTQGRRLRVVLGEQVDRRVREGRRTELAILRVVSVAGRAGARVGISNLQLTLDLSNDDLSDALRRLIAEHLVQKLNDGECLGSLHQIRATALADITHEVPPPRAHETIAQALASIESEDLESFITRTLAVDFQASGVVVAGLLDRLTRNQNLDLVGPLLRGLDAGSIDETMGRWLPQLEGLGLPPTQATTAAMFARANTEPFLIERLRPLSEAAARLRQLPHEDLRQALLAQLEAHFEPLLEASSQSWDAVAGFLTASEGTPLPHAIEAALLKHQPELLHMPLASAIDLLEAAASTSSRLPDAWVRGVGQAALLARIASETPWVSLPDLRAEPEGLAICAEVFHVADRHLPDLHGFVVDLCRRLLALAPTAELAVVTAISPDRRPVGIGGIDVAAKRIPRKSLPVRASISRNRIWIATAARRVAPTSLSQFLSQATSLLDDLVPALKRTVDRGLRGKPWDQSLEPLGRINDASRGLSRPPDPDQVDKVEASISDIQSILNYCSAGLLRGLLLELPDRAAATYSRMTNALDQSERARTQEPWVLIDHGPPSSLAELMELLEQTRNILGEAGARTVKAHELCPKLVKASLPSRALKSLSSWVDRQVERQLSELNTALEKAVERNGFSGRASSRRTHDLCGPWPYAEALAVIELPQIEDWYVALSVLAEPLREVGGDGRRLMICPAVNNFAVPDLAVGGVLTLLPCQNITQAWMESLGFSTLPLVLTRAVEDFASSLQELSAIDIFGCAVEGRAPAEQAAKENAVRGLENALSEIERLAPCSGNVEIQEIVSLLLREMHALAADCWSSVRTGELSTATVLLADLKVRAIAADLQAASAPT